MKLIAVFSVFLFAIALTVLGQNSRPTIIHVDASQASIGVLHARIVFPAAPGPMVIAYPKWIPGEHAPTGPINQMVRLIFSANGKQLPWRRDEIEPFEFHLDVPLDAKEVVADLDLACEIGTGGFTPAICSSQNQLVLNWNLVALYSPVVSNDRNPFSATLRLPKGWRYGTPLAVEKEDEAEISFKTASLKTLVDSPVIAGEHFRTVPLGGDHQVELDMIAETAEGLQITPQQKAHFTSLVAETTALFVLRLIHFGNSR
jgi:predicted metalloprotease with PDZ domain